MSWTLKIGFDYPGREEDLAQLMLSENYEGAFRHMPRLVGRVIALATSNGKRRASQDAYQTAAYNILGLEPPASEPIRTGLFRGVLRATSSTKIDGRNEMAEELGTFAHGKHLIKVNMKRALRMEYAENHQEKLLAAKAYRQVRLFLNANGLSDMQQIKMFPPDLHFTPAPWSLTHAATEFTVRGNTFRLATVRSNHAALIESGKMFMGVKMVLGIRPVDATRNDLYLASVSPVIRIGGVRHKGEITMSTVQVSQAQVEALTHIPQRVVLTP